MTPRADIYAVSRVVVVFWFALCFPGFADVLVGRNGERFVGRVIEESADFVIFESETGGRLRIPRSKVGELQREPSGKQETPNAALEPPVKTATTNLLNWRPPGVGQDGFDWIQLKSGEWLKGYLNYVQDKKVQFESDKLEDLSLKLKDVRQLYTGNPMFAKFDDRGEAYGTIVLSNETVVVLGPEQLQVSRGFLRGITPGGPREIEFWSGKLNLGLNLQSGNSRQVTMNVSGELARRSPATQVLLTYLGNFNEVDGVENANNHRVNLTYDIRLNRHWFIRPIQAEYYKDPLANIAHRITAGVGLGYYIFDRDGLEWVVAAGPAYQFTRFGTVAADESDTATTPAATLQTRFKADITSKLTFIQSYGATVTHESAGLFSHHLVSTVEFEIKRFLDLDLSFVWDYLHNPQTEASGVVPQHSDFRLTLGLGVKF